MSLDPYELYSTGSSFSHPRGVGANTTRQHIFGDYLYHLCYLYLCLSLALDQYLRLLGLSYLRLFKRVYLYHWDSWKLYISLQMISFVFYKLLLLLRLFAKIALVCLVVIPNALGGKLKFYGRTNLGGKPRLSYIINASKAKSLVQFNGIAWSSL